MLRNLSDFWVASHAGEKHAIPYISLSLVVYPLTPFSLVIYPWHPSHYYVLGEGSSHGQGVPHPVLRCTPSWPGWGVPHPVLVKGVPHSDLARGVGPSCPGWQGTLSCPGQGVAHHGVPLGKDIRPMEVLRDGDGVHLPLVVGKLKT